MRPRGKGLPLFGAQGRGDLDLRIKVKMPERLTAEERALYEKLRGLGHSRRWGTTQIKMTIKTKKTAEAISP